MSKRTWLLPVQAEPKQPDPNAGTLRNMRTITAAIVTVLLAGCSSAPAEPDANAKLIEQRYSDCVPGLKAQEIKRLSDQRYTWTDGEWVLAWQIGDTNAETGQPFTAPAEDALPQFEKLGCM